MSSRCNETSEIDCLTRSASSSLHNEMSAKQCGFTTMGLTESKKPPADEAMYYPAPPSITIS